MSPKRLLRTRIRTNHLRSGCTLNELLVILFAFAGLLFGARFGWSLAGAYSTLGHILTAAGGGLIGFFVGVLSGIAFVELLEKLPKWKPTAGSARLEPEARGRKTPEWVVIPLLTGLTAAMAAWIVWTDPKPVQPPLTKPLIVAACAGVGLLSSCGTWLCRRLWSKGV